MEKFFFILTRPKNKNKNVVFPVTVFPEGRVGRSIFFLYTLITSTSY